MPVLPVVQAWRLVGITYELDAGGQWLPVVRHEFYGPTAERTIEVRDRHLQADAFLRGCESGSYGPIQCRTYWYHPERT